MKIAKTDFVREVMRSIMKFSTYEQINLKSALNIDRLGV